MTLVRLNLTVIVLAWTSLSCEALAATQPCATVSDCAYQLLNQRTVANQSSFYVYQDADSGFNHGFASGLFGSTDVNLRSVVIESACVDAPTSPTGCSSDPTALDQTRGTVFRITLPSLAPSDYVGLNFQDPESYVPGDGSNGYNLSPATAVQFDVRSPGGAMVQFGVGGCVTGFYPLGATWQTLTIPLNTLYPPPGGSSGACPPDVSSTHILFTVTTDGVEQPGGGTILLDNIQFTPVPSRQSSGNTALSLPLSTQSFGVVYQTSNPIPPDQANRNLAAIYESALTVLSLLKRGQGRDVANALEIAGALDYALHHDNHGDPLPVAPGGSVGLHNAYMSGDIGLLNAQPSGARAGDARLAGYTGGTGLCGSGGFCLVLDGATGGNNAWAIFALAAAYLESGTSYYLTDAETIGSWIIGKLRDPDPGGFGGYFVGFNDASNQAPNFGKSTENNGDIFAAFNLLSEIEMVRGNSTAATTWLNAANVAGDFVAAMYDGTSKHFFTGTVTATDAQNPGAGVCPSAVLKADNDVVNTCEFIDSNTFTILPMAAVPRYNPPNSNINWAAVLQYVLNYSNSGATYTQSVTAAGQNYQGFDLVPAPSATGVAFEFTGQVAETCSYVGYLLSVSTFQNCASTYLAQIQKAQTSAPFADGLGLVASVLQNGNTLVPVNQCLSTPFQCIPERVGLAATNWAIMTDQQFNPMAYAAASFSPAQVNFPAVTTGTVSPTMAITLTNAGTAMLIVASISVTGANSSEFKETDNCVSVGPLTPGRSCTINVVFQPIAAGTRTASLILSTNGISGPLSLSGVATPADDFSLTVLPSSQSVVPGRTVTYSIQTAITSGHPQQLTLSVSGLPPGTSASFATNPIQAGGSSTLTVSAAISLQTVPGQSTLTVTAAEAETAHSAQSTLNIQAPLTFSASGLQFASQTVGASSAGQSVVITNATSVVLPIVLLVTGPNSGEFIQTNTCPSQLSSAGTCAVTVRFLPAGTGPRSATLLIESPSVAAQQLGMGGAGAGSCTTISGCAYSLLSQRVSANSASFYVYKDADSGLNHGTPSGVFTSGVDTSAVLINAGCVDSPTSASGCSGDPNALDLTRGTVFSLTFPGLTGTQYAGLNMQEPSNYTVGDGSIGYNLTSATAVTFDVRSPQGAVVRFGVGGCVTGYVTLPTLWTTLTIPLNSLVSNSQNVACPPDLTNVHLLFAVSADSTLGVNGATILLDNIQFTPTPSRQASVPSLPVSVQTFGVVPQLNYPIPTDQVNRNPATLYESALTTLAFLARGQAQDINSAVTVANSLDYALHHDNHGDPIPTAGTYAGLHSAYEAGDLAFLNAQAPSIGLGQAGDVRLSGFTASANLCGATQFCLVLDGGAGGNNAWATLALAAAYVHTGNLAYLNDAEELGTWIATALADNSGTGYGGYVIGYSDGGSPKQLQLGKSIEQNADIFAAFNLLAQIESMRGNTSAANLWASQAKIAGDFVIQMFDSTKGRFNAGTVDNVFTTGPGPGVCPSSTQIKGHDTVNTCDFLDANTAPVLAMSGSTTYNNAINWSLPIQYLANFAQTVTAAGVTYQGFDLLSASAGTGIGWEFTSQAVAAYETGLDTTGSGAINTYLQQLLQAQNSAPFGDGSGIVAATLQNGDSLTPVAQCLNTPYQCIPERVALASTSWAAMAEQGMNPMSPSASPTSISPSALSFGAQQIGVATPGQIVKVTNTGSVTVALTVSIAGSNAGDFSQAQSGCPAVLNAGSSCSVTVNFKPLAQGSRNAVLSIAQKPAWASQPEISNLALSGTGILVYTISGQVAVSGVGLNGVTINVTGSTTTSTTTNASGNYSIALAANGTYTLTASLSGYSFSAPVTFSSLSENGSANFTGVAVTNDCVGMFSTTTNLACSAMNQGAFQGNLAISIGAQTTYYGAMTLVGNVPFGDAAGMALYNAGGGAGTSVSLDLYNTAANGGIPQAKIKAIDDGNYSDHLTFWTKTPGSSTNAVTEKVRITSTGSVGIGTTTPTLGPLQMGSGAYVTAGGVWTNASDRNLKENFVPVNPAILQKIDALPVTEWNYKNEDPSVRHIGPVAQDFYSIFGVGNSSTSISTIDPSGIALAGIQSLDEKSQERAGRLAELKKQLGAKTEELRALRERLARLESLLEQTTSGDKTR